MNVDLIPNVTRRKVVRLLSLVFGVMLLVTTALGRPACADGRTTRWRQAVVAADHPAASRAGIEMLQQGGNVVDAAVATSFALSVARPSSCGIGGGGFMVIWNAEKQEAVALDYRERAPLAATRDMFAGESQSENIEAGSVRGGKAVAVPGTVAGLCFAAREYGSLPLSVLLKPAIRLALNGVRTDAHDRQVQASTLTKLKRYPDAANRFPCLQECYLNHGRPWQAGQSFRSPLWRVLYRISKHGPSAFYRGEVAHAIVRAVERSDGVMTMEDLASTNPVVRQPVRGSFHEFEICSMPPASSGGIALLQTVQALEQWEDIHGVALSSLEQDSPDYIHVVTEAMKHAFADRAEFLGDSDFTSIPQNRLLSQKYAREVARRIQRNQTLDSDEYGRFFAADDSGTSHFSVIDAAGNAVACTETINLTFGSFVVVPEFGIILNNQMDDFAARPGEPNAFGLMQSEANVIAPRKKPLSSMTPTIVVRDGKAVFASGASGGPRIISSTIQATLNHLVFDMPPQEAVSAPRFHHQWFPNEILLESPLYESAGANLQERGHRIRRVATLAANQSVASGESGLTGGSDPRKHGRPAGF